MPLGLIHNQDIFLISASNALSVIFARSAASLMLSKPSLTKPYKGSYFALRLPFSSRSFIISSTALHTSITSASSGISRRSIRNSFDYSCRICFHKHTRVVGQKFSQFLFVYGILDVPDYFTRLVENFPNPLCPALPGQSSESDNPAQKFSSFSFLTAIILCKDSGPSHSFAPGKCSTNVITGVILSFL